MDLKERFSDGEAALRVAMRGLMARVWTALPATVVSYNAVAGTIVAQPTIQAVQQEQNGTLSNITLPVLPDVPVVFPAGGGCTLTFPIKAGDECLIVFASRSIDAWWQGGGVQPQIEPRMHDLSDGFAIFGPRSKPNVAPNASTSTTQLRSDDGSTYVELNATGQMVNVVAPGGVKITTPTLEITGALKVDQTVTASGNISSSGGDVLGGPTQISLINHLTTGVTTGGGVSGPPQA